MRIGRPEMDVRGDIHRLRKGRNVIDTKVNVAGMMALTGVMMIFGRAIMAMFSIVMIMMMMTNTDLLDVSTLILKEG
jgi:hypothetical protein